SNSLKEKTLSPSNSTLKGDRVFSLRLFDPISCLSFKNIDKAVISPCFSLEKASIFDYINEEIILDEEVSLKDEVENEGFVWEDIKKKMLNPYCLTSLKEGKFNFSSPPSFNGRISEFLQSVRSWVSEKKGVIVCCSYSGQAERMKDLLLEANIPSVFEIPHSAFASPYFVCRIPHLNVVVAPISSGFSFDRTIVITHNEIFGKPHLFTRKFRERKITPIASISELKIGDYAVHISYGIGRYLGIKSLSVCGRIRDFLFLEYKGSDRLYIPVERIDLVEKYVGPANPLINRLGNGIWERTKKRVKEEATEYARRLLSLYAERKAHPGNRFSPDTIWQHQLEAGFIYQETPDQIKAIAEIKQDMESNKPMDRLLVGDVGFGKTEVAIRASFKAVIDGFQVAILVPTTILAHQHYNTFCERLCGFPVNIGLVSRFKKREEIREIIKGLKEGNVDIVIGTHRLLSKDISFKNLGLLIIDDEQRFGVLQKEKLKGFKKTLDYLSISATPIPRTLYFGMSSLMDVSIINTPPKGRQEILTYISKFSPEVIE
ncbi:MAG: DEAD/DEAH box helicase, partial [bacterium]